MLEFEGALFQWHHAAHPSGLLKALRRVRALCDSTYCAGKFHSPFRAYKLPNHGVWKVKFRTLVLQVKELTGSVGLNVPPGSLLRAVALKARLCSTIASKQAQKCEDEFYHQRDTSWKQWVKDSLSRGASMAHQYTKQPLTLSRADYVGSSKNRADVLGEQVDAWSSLWQADKVRPVLQFGSVDRLPVLTGKDLLTVSKLFPPKTCAMLGIHPRHFSHLPLESLDVLAKLFMLSEAIGVMPQQTMITIITLIPKPTAGVRPIGIFHSGFRLWAKARRSLVDDWETRCADMPEFAAAKHRSSTNVVWRHSMKGEFAKANRRHFAVIMWDLLKCYEHMDHQVLVRAARNHRYPLALLRLTLAVYAADRHIVYEGLASASMQASRGIVAGSAMATSELKLVLIDVVRQHNVLHPGIFLRILVDDISLDLDNAHLYDLVDQLSDAASTLAHQVENRIGLPIARDKSAIVCSSARVSSALRHRLRELGGPPLGAARNLGVDFAGGNKFGKCGLQTRRSRWIKARIRWHRVSTLSKTNKAAAAAVVVSGINVSLLFDAPVLGCFGRGLDVIRKKTGRLLGVAGCKRNINLGFSFLSEEDSRVCSSVACVERLCAEAWEAGLPPGAGTPAPWLWGI